MIKYDKTDLGNIESFFDVLIDKKYEFIFFDQLSKTNNQVIIRHDIDFDVDAALTMAKIEHQCGINATYFFLMASDSYNPYSLENYSKIREIAKLGHAISIHFDPTNYEDYVHGFQKEKNIFEMMFDTEVKIISLHRPNAYFLENDMPIMDCDHTYMSKYIKDIKYVADSRGTFRFDHAFETEAFVKSESLHILLHPIWWIYTGTSRYEKLKNFYSVKKNSLKEYYANNCLPFKEIKDELF